MRTRTHSIGVAAFILVSTGCSEGAPETSGGAWARGQLVYKNVCVACHNPDPAQQGSLGPPIAGSSRELVEARVVHGKYPDGYEPKLPSQSMPAFPHLAESVDALTAFLNDDRDG